MQVLCLKDSGQLEILVVERLVKIVSVSVVGIYLIDDHTYLSKRNVSFQS